MKSITNQAGIYFDRNEVVMTNTTLNTIKDNPIADFTFTRQCATNAYDFMYTGGSTGATFFWDFGADATPSTSTEQNPTGVEFSTSGSHSVTLTISQGGGCSADTTKTVVTEDVTASNGRIKVCFKGKTITVSQNALPALLAQGACIGSCNFSAKTENDFSETTNKIQPLNFSVYPNPVNDNAIINFSLLDGTYVNIDVYNYLGEKVIDVFKGNVKSGENYTFDINLKPIVDGIYFIFLKTRDERKIIKVIKLK